MILLSNSVIPIFALALTSKAWLQSSPIVCSISDFTRSGAAAGKSILFKTGMISRLFSNAI